MTKEQILKKWPLLTKILVENGILHRSELNFLEVQMPEYKNTHVSSSYQIKGSYRTFVAGVNGNTLTVYAEVDAQEKIISSFTEWSEEFST